MSDGIDSPSTLSGRTVAARDTARRIGIGISGEHRATIYYVMARGRDGRTRARTRSSPARAATPASAGTARQEGMPLSCNPRRQYRGRTLFLSVDTDLHDRLPHRALRACDHSRWCDPGVTLGTRSNVATHDAAATLDSVTKCDFTAPIECRAKHDAAVIPDSSTQV